MIPKIEGEFKMEKFEEQRTKPRLYRVALELSKFDDPYRTLDMLLALVKSTQKKEGASHE